MPQPSTKIALFFHCLISGGSVPINTDNALNIIAEQMLAFKESGLGDAAEEFYVGVNGGEADAAAVSMLTPDKAVVIAHGPNATSEIPTMNLIRDWLPGHEDWKVYYSHTKGVTHPGEEAYAVWRRRMENTAVWNWRQCVADLDGGFDAVGSHWLTPEQFPHAVRSPFFGGTFWWAKADYLRTLRPLPPSSWENRFEAESWIGYSPRRPRVRDYIPGWP